MLLLVLLIMFCSMIGTVFLIGLCGSLSVANILPVPPRDDTPSIVIEEPFREDWDTNANYEYGVSGKSAGEDPIKADFRERIASSSVPILRSRGMTDEEIKFELLRDFALTEEQVDGILQRSKYPKP